MSSPRTVIVFGPTGKVGSVAALTAHEEGAKVILAMRDPSKSIPILDGLCIERVQADLTKPETISTAVRQTGAKHAFIYIAHGGNDGMRGSITALKNAGIESVVFLSSFTIKHDIRAVPPTELVPYIHAQVEISLDDIFAENGVAVRPGYFASNSLQMKSDCLAGEVKLPNPDALFDWIAPGDIGRVCGSILAHGTEERVVPVVGPHKLSYHEVVAEIGRVIGKELRITKVSGEEAVQVMSDKLHVPRHFAEWFVTNITGDSSDISNSPDYAKAVENIWKYNKEPVTFEQWLSENKALFLA
ncbi:hypothetical protein N7478_012307 [Penicillium angulare]|uniref:uncharacterized protein n=1 Tax=Penicillium angulare TaxID=116970 RepID=UPI0025422628|nr:uncharacterized protein N7478_012307 [Penicillium angulare]KAJ5259326.1 hypothetical protein N7478_012307 [Penicillium angulare]